MSVELESAVMPAALQGLESDEADMSSVPTLFDVLIELANAMLIGNIVDAGRWIWCLNLNQVNMKANPFNATYLDEVYNICLLGSFQVHRYVGNQYQVGGIGRNELLIVEHRFRVQCAKDVAH